MKWSTEQTVKDECLLEKSLYYKYALKYFTFFTTSVGVNASRIRIGASVGLRSNEKLNLIWIGEKQSKQPWKEDTVLPSQYHKES